MSELRGHRRSRVPKRFKRQARANGQTVERRGKHIYVDGHKLRTNERMSVE